MPVRGGGSEGVEWGGEADEKEDIKFHMKSRERGVRSEEWRGEG